MPDTCGNYESATRIECFDPSALKISHENELTALQHFDVHVRSVSVRRETRARGSTVVLTEWT